MTKKKLVMLTLTEYCNLDCVYCYEKEKTKKSMSIATAKNAVQYAFANSDDFDEIEFDLFGGEPTSRKKLIMDLVEWTISQDFQKPFLFFLETNGTLVHGDFQTWLINHKKHVHVGISLDGTPETHNKNRSNSYGQIDIDFFSRNYPNQGARMTVHPNSVGTFFDDVCYLNSLGFSRVDAFFAFGIDWSSTEVQSNLTRELRKLCDYYVDNPEIPECSVFDIKLPILTKEKHVRKWCGTGTDMMAFSVDGGKYPCQMFQPLSVPASINPVRLEDAAFPSISDFSDPECEKCSLEPLCPNCYGMNYLASGDMLKREKSLCEITKIRALATSYLRAKQINNGSAKLRPEETYQTIKAIQLVQREITAQ